MKAILIKKYVMMLVVVLKYLRRLGSSLFGNTRCMENPTVGQ